MTEIIGLVIFGAILIFLEILIPGGILGLIAAGMMISAVYMAFTQYGSLYGLIVMLISVSIATIALYLQFKLLPKTKFGKKFFIPESSDGKTEYQKVSPDLIGKNGEAITNFSPTGIILIENKEYEAFSQEGYLTKGQNLQVVAFDNFRLIIEKQK